MARSKFSCESNSNDVDPSGRSHEITLWAVEADSDASSEDSISEIVMTVFGKAQEWFKVGQSYYVDFAEVSE